MNINDGKYSEFALIREMLETVEVIKALDVEKIKSFDVKKEKVLLTGEGSSRIFPAKNTVSASLMRGYRQYIVTENDSQAMEYDLKDFSVFAASNSGKTAEAVRLIKGLRAQGHHDITAVVANDGTPIAEEADAKYVLTCGKEEAVAATKSVVEQALFYDILFRGHNGHPLPKMGPLSAAFEAVLTQDIPGEIIDTLAAAPVLYFSGRNNGVAEELRLKTNEITRKKSDYLEGTYAVHGIEEVMRSDEAVILIDPFKDELEKIRKVLAEGVGLNVITVSCYETGFSNITVPDMGEFSPCLHLAAGWNLLVETGLALAIDLDRPERARKVGNEYAGE